MHMNKLLLVFLLPSLFWFEPKKSLNEIGQTSKFARPLPVEERYKLLKDSVRLMRESWRANMELGLNNDSILRLASKSFTNLVFNDYYKIWAGTPWSFYGKSQVPNKGEIACGYFVTTVLRDMGVKINRVEMAETYSEKMIKSLIQPKSIKKYTPFNLVVFVNELKLKADGVYLVGLDYHTGFVVIKNHEVYFIHSTVLEPGCVVKEIALQSVALQINQYTVLGNLTDDKEFMRKWVMN